MTLLEIDLNKLEHNYSSLRKRLNQHSKMIGVVKANAYGSLSGLIAKKLVDLGVEALAVAYTQEALELREDGIEIPLIVFYPQVGSFRDIILNNIEPVLYSKRSWEKFKEVLSEEKKMPYPIHIKYNTGLNRIGFHPDEAVWVLEQLEDSSFNVKSVYSHLAQTEAPKPNEKTENQIFLFEQIMAKHIQASSQRPEFHLLNTSGVFNYPKYHLDWVRIGIGLYGFANHPEWNKTLQPIAQLKTKITQIHQITSGETVGYNCGWKAPKNSRIAVLPIGHADGFSRQYGHGKGWVMINGEKAHIVGNICMDMLMVDIGDIPCNEGSVVEILGSEIRADELAENAGTISYELITALGNRIPRVLKT
ncbi:alanine racemase [Flavobacteriaceae bacterium]|nr:alanine racemase [Flavobacteriaceae bacterium]